MLPHNHNLNLAQGVVELVRYTEDDVLFSVFPLFHANAKYMTVLAALVSGARAVINRRFSASRFWEICRSEGVTAFNGQGEMLRILLKQPESDADRDNTVRVVVGAAAATDLVEQFEQRYDLAVLDAYGMTETGPTIAASWEARRAGAAGLPTPWYEAKVVDADDVEVPPGVTGEIVVRPKLPFVMMERYWGNDAATLDSMRNLWFHTGDNAYRDEDGYFWFVARGTDSIRRRGENVSAWEVERVLADHPELLEAAVYGVPSELGGQEVMVACVRRPESEITAEELLDFCTGKMPHFAVPRYVRFMDQLPRSHAQRVLKPELKAAGADAPGVWDRESVGYQGGAMNLARQGGGGHRRRRRDRPLDRAAARRRGRARGRARHPAGDRSEEHRAGGRRRPGRRLRRVRQRLRERGDRARRGRARPDRHPGQQRGRDRHGPPAPRQAAGRASSARRRSTGASRRRWTRSCG